MTEPLEQHQPYQEVPLPDALVVSRPEIQQGFVTASEWLTETTIDPEFRKYHMEWGVAPNDQRDPNYWRALMSYGYDSAANVRQESGSSVEIDAFELATATTAYVLEQHGMNHGGFNSYEERESARQTTSYFNGIIRSFAENYPEVDVTDILAPLTKIVNTTMPQRGLRQDGEKYIKDVIHGAQHELGFGQILRAGGAKFRPASQEEDLHGIDYVVDNGHGKAVFVDVKASLSQIEARGSEKVFAVKKDHGTSRVIMYSCIREDEFGGKFWLSEEVAAQKAPVVLAQLASAAKAA